ncbi:MAG: 3-isopropylmalate dehydratase large subunit [bacterium]
MGMTITEKIIAAHSGEKHLHPGQFVEAHVDIALGNDITSPLAIKEFEAAGVKKVFDHKKVVLVPDHFTPNKDIQSAEQVNILRKFAARQKLTYFFDNGDVGVEHALLPEQGIVGPGDLVIGADSHTCTYGALGAFATGVGSTDLAAAMVTGKVWLKVPETIQFEFIGRLPAWIGGKDLILTVIGKIGVDGALYSAMEFVGKPIQSLSMSERLAMCNMAIEAGGKNGIIAPDAVTRAYIRNRFTRKPVFYESDKDAQYIKTIKIDVGFMEPVVAVPNLPSNVKPVSACRGISVNQVVIGSCTNGRIEDLRIAAEIIKGKKVYKGVRLLIIPATPWIYRQALKEGLMDIFSKAGAIISPPTCGPCLGGHMGILAAGERCLATTNRNFVGRMGHVKSEVYLAGAPVAAATAIKGKISHPDRVIRSKKIKRK